MADTPARPRTDLDLDAVRSTLQAEHDGLTEQLRRLGEAGAEAGEGDDSEDADQGTELFLREQDGAVRGVIKADRDRVEAAIRKLDAGTYGLCERCGTKIPKERLQALPAAVFCIPCATDMEGRL